MKDDDSMYRHFEGLRSMVAKGAAQVQVNKENGSVLAAPVDDENDLFREAMKDVKRLREGKSRIANSLPPLRSAPATSPEWERRMLEEILDERHGINTIDLPEYMEGYAEDINPLTMEKLRRGEFSVQKVLDLHGYTSEDGEALFEEFLRDSIRSNLRCIKVIHGRGLKSKAGPVLKEKLKEWIMRAMHRKWITGFSSAPMKEGGPGATNILLKKQPAKKGFRIVG